MRGMRVSWRRRGGEYGFSFFFLLFLEFGCGCGSSGCLILWCWWLLISSY